MAGTSYKIADEPQPSTMAKLAVHPMWPLFGHMFGGAVLAWPWYVVNGMAIGSPTRWKELAVALGGFIFSAAFAFTILFLLNAEVVPESSAPYLGITLTVFKLGISYCLFTLQDRSFELYRYFGGIFRSGLPLVILGAIVLRRMLDSHVLLLLLLR